MQRREISVKECRWEYGVIVTTYRQLFEKGSRAKQVGADVLEMFRPSIDVQRFESSSNVRDELEEGIGERRVVAA